MHYTIALLFVASIAAAGPELKIPAEVTPVDGYAIVEVGEGVKAVSYVGKSGVEAFPSRFLADKRVFILPTTGLSAGRYKFVAIGSLNDEHARAEFVVVVGNAPPVPPPMPPNPNPPPAPPVPPPTPPGPSPEPFDSLVEAVRTALKNDPGAVADKAKWAAAYAGLLSAGIDHMAKVNTIGELWEDFKAAAKDVMPAGSLPGVQKVCVGELLFILGGDRNGSVDAEKVLDADTKVKLAAMLKRLAGALTGSGK